MQNNINFPKDGSARFTPFSVMQKRSILRYFSMAPFSLIGKVGGSESYPVLEARPNSELGHYLGDENPVLSFAGKYDEYRIDEITTESKEGLRRVRHLNSNPEWRFSGRYGDVIIHARLPYNKGFHEYSFKLVVPRPYELIFANQVDIGMNI